MLNEDIKKITKKLFESTQVNLLNLQLGL
jgi:hypothetical protein